MFGLAQLTKIDSQTDKKPHLPRRTDANEAPRGQGDGSFKDVRLGDILKEFAAQVDMKSDQPLTVDLRGRVPFREADLVHDQGASRSKRYSTSC